LAASLAVPFHELDGVFHQPGWTELPRDEFRQRVSELVRGDGWVIDGNYSAVQDLVWERADTVIWFEIGRAAVMRRVIARTIRRAVTREELWNGNREPLDNFYRWDPRRNVIRWAWVHYRTYAERYRAASEDPQYGHLRFVRFGTPKAADAWLARAADQPGADASELDAGVAGVGSPAFDLGIEHPEPGVGAG
jgi:adenylate kinase family enzyme